MAVCTPPGRAVSRRLPTAGSRIRDRFKLCGICGGQSDTGEGFLPVLRFPCQVFHRLLHGAGKIGHILA
jgi:hypothetical protein